MFFHSRGALRRAGLAALLLWQAPLAADTPLTLPEAEDIALARDGAMESLRAEQEALGESAVAAAELPDPEMRFGALNLPTDSFELDQEPMTQLLVGLRQRFPRGATRGLERERGEVMATAQEARAGERARAVRRSLRQAWIEHAWTVGAVALLNEQQVWFAQLEDAVTAAYESGRRPQHDVLRIAMERELLDERQVELRQAGLTARAELERWLGPDTRRDVARDLPALPPAAAGPSGAELVASHPLVVAGRREVEASSLSVDLARQQYRPAWALDVAYGLRQGEDPDGDDRPDFFSAMISFDVPLFTSQRQDRRVASAAAAERSRRARLTDLQRELLGGYEAAAARWQTLAERVQVYERRILPSAEANVTATRQAYRNDVVPFDELVGAEKALLEARTRLLRLRADRLLAQADMLYFTGDDS